MNKKSRIAILVGSVAENSNSMKAADIVADEIRTNTDYQADIVDPREFDLPLPGLGIVNDSRKKLQSVVEKSSAVVLVTPEYNGGFSSVMKLMIENMNYPSELSGKPIALLGVAAGDMGAIKSIEALRIVVSHVGGFVLPNATSVPNVNEVFDSNGNTTDEKAERRIRRVVKDLALFLEKKF